MKLAIFVMSIALSLTFTGCASQKVNQDIASSESKSEKEEVKERKDRVCLGKRTGSRLAKCRR